MVFWCYEENGTDGRVDLSQELNVRVELIGDDDRFGKARRE